MFGFSPYGTNAFASLGGRVHVLSCLENAECLDNVRITLALAIRVEHNTSGTSNDSGQAGNMPGVLEGSIGGGDSSARTILPGNVAESGGSTANHTLQLGIVPVRILEVLHTADAPPFTRQKWAFVPTATGGQWVLVPTGE